MNLDKLKESARKYEQSGQWRPAIDVYKKALREFEEAGEGVPDPSLYNRIGDLEMKDGESGAAIRAYEQAADLYTEQGFFNNAIALCGKILRINQGRASTYLRLAQLNARKNFASDAKKNLSEYLERMQALSHQEEAIGAVKVFAEQFSSNPDVRTALIELLRTDAFGPDGSAGLERIAEELEGAGQSGARRAPERAAQGEDVVAPAPRSGSGDLVFIDVNAEGPPSADSVADDPIDGLELTHAEPEEEDAWRRDTATIDGMEIIAPSIGGDEGDDAEAGVVEELDDIDAFPSVEGGLEVDGMDLVDSRLDPNARGSGAYPPLAETYETLDEAVHADPVESAEDLVYLNVDTEEPEREAPSQDPGLAACDRARVLMEVGDREGAVAALDAAIEYFDQAARFDEALDTIDQLLALEPDAIFRYQKRVEIAYRSGRRDVMLASYLKLADALRAGGGVDHALTVYKRVLEHDPGNDIARAAIATLTAPERRPEPAQSFVDLGSLILDDQQVRDTRIRVEQEAPVEDEDQAFHEALSQFKRGIEENIDSEDFQAHYDLGIAFKEMGLLDEAIAQFQKALRAPEGRLKTSEQLGIAFFEKSRFAIAEAVLRRAVESLPGGDEEKIGLIYWLGRAVEAQRRSDEAVRCFERVLAVDIRFLDVGDRVQRLTADPE
ncbi:MAG: tetratricopeptide repeat protein [Gemmatimonadales bacterium]